MITLISTRVENSAIALQAFAIELDSIMHELDDSINAIRFDRDKSLQEFGDNWDTFKMTRSLLRETERVVSRAFRVSRRLELHESGRPIK